MPCVFLLSTVLGALCLLVTSLIYLRAALANEKWIPCDIIVQKDGGKSIKRLRPPSMAPPRMRQAQKNNAFDNGDAAPDADNKV